jgi:hypothetical protein
MAENGRQWTMGTKAGKNVQKSSGNHNTQNQKMKKKRRKQLNGPVQGGDFRPELVAPPPAGLIQFRTGGQLLGGRNQKSKVDALKRWAKWENADGRIAQGGGARTDQTVPHPIYVLAKQKSSFPRNFCVLKID